MRKALIIIFVIAVIAALSLLYYFLVYLPSQDITPAPKEGSPCKKDLLPGTIKNGQCVVNAPKSEQLPCGGKLNPC